MNLTLLKLEKNYDDKLDIYDFECNIYMGGKNGRSVFSVNPSSTITTLLTLCSQMKQDFVI